MQLVFASRSEGKQLAVAVKEFRTRLKTRMVASNRPPDLFPEKNTSC